MAASAVSLGLIRRQCPVRRLIVASAMVLGIAAGVFAILRLGLGFDIIATFQVSQHNQAMLAERMARPYPDTAIFDLWGLALGVGWMPAALFVMQLFEQRELEGDGTQPYLWITLLLMLVLAVFAILPAETTRLWIFVCPLVLLATGRQLRRWSRQQRLAFLFVAVLNLVAIGQNMEFLTLST